MAKQSGWVTINGVHVFIDSKSGKITQGPAKFIGSTLNDLPSNKSSQSDLKARLKAKQAEKSPVSKAISKAKADREANPSKKEKAEGLIERAQIKNGTNKTKELSEMSKSELRKLKRDIENEIAKETKKSDPDSYNIAAMEDKWLQIDEALGRESLNQDFNKLLKTSDVKKPTLSDYKNSNISKYGLEEFNAREHGVKIGDKYYQTSTGIDGKVFVELPNKSVPLDEFKKQQAKFTSSKAQTGNANFDNATSTNKVVKDADYYHQRAMRFIKVVEADEPHTGNANFDKATNTNKAVSGKQSGLTVRHFDGFRSSGNEYRIDGKRVSAKEARAQFPENFDSKGRFKGFK